MRRTVFVVRACARAQAHLLYNATTSPLSMIRKPRHAGGFRTDSYTQAVFEFQCTRILKCIIRHSASPKPPPLNPTPAACHKRKRKLRCRFWNAALQKLHCNIRFSAVRKSFLPKAALQQAKNCTATSTSLRCRKVALSCRFPAGFKPPRLGTHVSDLLRHARS